MIEVLVALAIALYLCWLIVQPFVNVLLWATVLAIVFYPLHRRIRLGIRSPAAAAAFSTLLVIVLLMGPTLFILQEFVVSIGLYFQNLLRLSFDTGAMQGPAGAQWQGWWTTFYWGWWMSWAPFVGVFIARISRGRTVREFVAGVLLVPTAVTFLWLTVFGGSALYREVFGAGGGVAADGSVDTEGSLFGLLGELPGGTALVAGAVILIVLFFVTSSDSGSLVVTMLSSGGDTEPPIWSRVFWATAEGVVAIALLFAGGLAALQVGAILIALPFSVVMLAMCVATWKAFGEERLRQIRIQRELEREKLTAQVSRNLIEEGWTDPHGGANGTRASPNGAGPARAEPADTADTAEDKV